MEKLLNVQLAQKEMLSQFVKNYESDSQTKRSRSYYEKRLKDFQKLWNEFRARHRQILTLLFSDPTLQEKDFDYFKNKTFETMEEIFITNFAAIEDKMKEEFSATMEGANSTQLSDSWISHEHIESTIKLPKISLEKFSGDYRKWPTFHDLFKTLIHENKSLAPVQKLQYLKLHLCGEPERLLRHFTITDNNYKTAWTLLTDRYNNSNVLVNAELKVLLSQNSVTNESAQGIKNLLDTTTECLQTLTNLNVNVEGWDPLVVYLIIQKLPRETHMLWEQSRSGAKSLASWDDLKQFLESRFRTLEAVSAKGFSSARDSRPQANNKPRPLSHSFHVSANMNCAICFEHHSIRQCPKFEASNASKRFELVKAKGLCINCLGSGHILVNCPSKQTCRLCNKRHHSLLHRNPEENRTIQTQNRSIAHTSHENRQSNVNHNENAISSSVLSATTPTFTPTSQQPSSSNHLSSFVTSERSRVQQILLATALVKIVSPQGQEILVKALIDQGSQASFVTESIVQLLKLKREAINANVLGVGQSQVGHVNAQTKFTIRSLKGDVAFEMSGLVLPKLTQLLPTRTILNRHWKHIEGLELADPQYYEPKRVDLLLGADVFSYIIMEGLIKGDEGSPVAQKTRLGWILSGKLLTEPNDQTKINNFHVCADLNNQLKQFWEIEEVKCERIQSEEEKNCEASFSKTCRRLSDGRYEVGLPFKEENSSNVLGQSRSIALSRLCHLMNRFQRDTNFKEEYSKCIREYLTLGHMEQAHTKEEDHLRLISDAMPTYDCCYLPHHGVIKETSTTTKLRIVFDASNTTKSGVSLNDKLAKGPVIQDELVTLLIRWRKHEIAFTADIEKMYRQVRIAPSHTDFQRIVWRDSGDSPIQDYRLLTVTFGTKSAPFLATRVLQQLASDERERFPIGSKIATKDFYIDDLLSGASTVDSALEAQRQVIELLKAGGFSLRKWASNHPRIVEHLPPEYREVNLPLNVPIDDNIQTLGIRWNPRTDKFSYSITIDSVPSQWTKRTILSVIAKLFDPLGWLAPITILGKTLIQQLWLTGLNWDQPIPKELENNWIKFRSQLKEIEKIRTSRWIRFSNDTISIEIHGFSDASIKAYSAAVYICTVNSKGERHVSLLAGKTKVAPIKTVSLPRLELCGAVLLAKLLKYIIKAFEFSQSTKCFAWTDSEIVLAWLQSHPSKWSTFIANRVSHIHSLLGENIWKHVPSKSNPADCASRGMYPMELLKHNLWWQGPEWLWKEDTHWPADKHETATDLEVRKTLVYNITIKDSFEQRYSSLTRLIRITAYCRRFCNNSRKSLKGETGYLKSSELQQALQILIKNMQLQYFSNEINSLKCNKPIEKKSKLLRLNPFIDADEILRVGGRLQHTNLSYNEKHPIILSDKSHLTKLIIEKSHIDTLHGGSQLMMTVLAKNYWLINARNTIRHLTHKCITCYRYRANAQTQLMGELPVSRVQIQRPFSHTGVDYCGPFDVKTHKGRNPKKYKAYIALFICMSTKAIHLELVTDLSSDGFIAAFRRFCARRGLCSQMYCDCGTNFVGANRILSKQKQRMMDQINYEIAESLENEGVKFNFIPPASPHFGGLWEAGVRSTKYHLKRVIGNVLLTYEEFTTVITQIEACLNSRPLCALSNDPQDLRPLTPGHFLIGDTLLTPPEPSVLELNINRLTRWQLVQHMYQSFWKRWNSEYLSRLQQRPKWLNKSENVKVGDLVILKEDNLPPSKWALARIIETHPGSDGLVRVVTLKAKETTLKRPITKICLLPIH